MMIRYALGVDIGGTKVSVTLGNSHGRILVKEILPTLTGRRTQEGIDRIVETLVRIRAENGKLQHVLGIGIGIAGPMDHEKGIVQRSPHLNGWQDFPLKSFLARKLRLPVFINNDANAAAVGEKVFGAGRHSDNFIYMTVSTGIGGGIILNGKLLLGASYGAGEVGHTIIVPEGEKCGCGNQGCLEAYASGTAIADFIQKAIRRGRPTILKKWVRTKDEITAKLVALAAEKGDSLSKEAFKRAGYYLGIGLANFINILNPEMLILGGSVMTAPRLLWPSMMSSAKKHAWPSLYEACKITKTELGNRVGDLGALALVFCARPKGRRCQG